MAPSRFNRENGKWGVWSLNKRVFVTFLSREAIKTSDNNNDNDYNGIALSKCRPGNLKTRISTTTIRP